MAALETTTKPERCGCADMARGYGVRMGLEGWVGGEGRRVGEKKEKQGEAHCRARAA